MRLSRAFLILFFALVVYESEGIVPSASHNWGKPSTSKGSGGPPSKGIPASRGGNNSVKECTIIKVKGSTKVKYPVDEPGCNEYCTKERGYKSGKCSIRSCVCKNDPIYFPPANNASRQLRLNSGYPV